MKRFFTCCLLVIFSLQAAAQRNLEEVEKPGFKDRIYFGGGGALQFTGGVFLVGVSPLAGYMITKKLSAGLGATYQYAHYRFADESTHTYGGRTFVRYNIFRSIYTTGEYEMLNFEMPQIGMDDEPRQWVDRLLFGGGYFQQLGGRGGFHIGLLYDFLYREGPGNPYTSPWVYRIGFTF
ncbi:hypothetical protein [Nafulsella turpanensis]|uniref:hypothetical protein n=1 Tax=Nafulsella turpanensis TaxID=1265690 RepID=UPI0003460CD5|nr:hypothetical protein [Nafulsella turpanensis]